MEELNDASKKILDKILITKNIVELEGTKYIKGGNGTLIPLHNDGNITNLIHRLSGIQLGFLSSYQDNRKQFGHGHTVYEGRQDPLAISGCYNQYVLFHYLYEQNKIQGEQIKMLVKKIEVLENRK